MNINIPVMQLKQEMHTSIVILSFVKFTLN